MSSISALTSNTSSLATLFGTSSKETSATSAFAAPEPGSETTGSMGSNALSSGSGFAALDGDMQTALLSLQEEMGGTGAATMPPPPPPPESTGESDSSSTEATATTASDSASTDSTASTDEASLSGGTSGASGAGESKEVISTTYLDNPDGSTTITVSYSDGSTSVTTTGGEGQSAPAPDAPQSNLPYSLGSGAAGSTSLSQTVSNLYASVANSTALASAAGVAA
ncbi:hypothetical protein [Pleomorphomonas koreensis]|uniref:hypothetical protein n=1 Tax=Pleomorphomonas koreensis TaxID=257440 RepID=UPI000412D732|nr:hypothetical protein [Pleomorphomonas koreensis]